MKASELRVGNLISYIDQTVYVLGIRQNNQFMAPSHNLELGYFIDSVGFERIEHDEHLKPIPLTEEWLLKFGFEKQGDLNYTRYRRKDPDALFSFGNYARPKNDPEYKPTLKASYKDGQTNQVSIHDLKYVHQLQNLYFSLTGEELTIKE